jgi:hypothetical protein
MSKQHSKTCVGSEQTESKLQIVLRQFAEQQVWKEMTHGAMVALDT